MLVADLMIHRVACVQEDTYLSHAAELLALTGLNDLVVVKGKKMVGTLSDGDILRALMPDLEELYKADISYAELNDYFTQSLESNTDKSILPLIIRNPIVLSPSDTIIKAVTIMLSKGIIRLPVVENGFCVGILGRNDISYGLTMQKFNKTGNHK
jgi:CBS domain-containing protein